MQRTLPADGPQSWQQSVPHWKSSCPASESSDVNHLHLFPAETFNTRASRYAYKISMITVSKINLYSFTVVVANMGGKSTSSYVVKGK